MVVLLSKRMTTIASYSLRYWNWSAVNPGTKCFLERDDQPDQQASQQGKYRRGTVRANWLEVTKLSK